MNARVAPLAIPPTNSSIVLDAATPTPPKGIAKLPPNYYRKNVANDEFKQVTSFPAPWGYPSE